MKYIDISDEAAASLATVAASRGCDANDLAVALLEQWLRERKVVDQLTYTPERVTHLRQGMAEADRGEFIPQEHAEAFFEDWKRNG